MNYQPDARIALLIDADNSPAAKIDVILAELAKFGVANIRRAYGNWKKNELKGWEQVLHEYAIRPIQQFDYSKGKNATDMVMAIDALDLLYTDRPEAFGIVSSDADFTPLVMHLRAKGAIVWGFGAKKTPEPFVNACSRFLYLETLGALDGAAAPVPVAAPAPAEAAPRRGRKAKAAAVEEPVAEAAPAPARRGRKGQAAVAEPPAPAVEEVAHAPGPASTLALKQDARLVTLLRNAVEGAAAEDGWSPLGAVGKQIGNQASFDPRNYGYKKLSDLIEASQLFEVERRNSHVYVRDRRAARASRG
ncbi:NYN domain-containing protein [Caldimonas tepidiphila]|uniref:NYN domain-containing protein n=1 Tax=Caldimonas tepidiphila TaxID=2315841 RepID=UPI000E5BDBD1|nr:NYN domain-containing protein [Caldimonas tepidiphila]